MASGREPVLMSIFTSDQYNPLIRYEEPEQTSDRPPTLGSRADQPSAPPYLEVMDLDVDLVAEPDPIAD